MPKVRIIHEDKDTSLSLNVTMAQGKQVVSVAAGADYEFDLAAGSTVDIAVQKTEHPNATMLQRIGDMLHFRHDTAAGKLNAGKQPSPVTEADLQAAHEEAMLGKGQAPANASSTASASPVPGAAASVPSSTNTSAGVSGEVGNGQQSAPVPTAPSVEPSLSPSPSVTEEPQQGVASAGTALAPSETGAEKAPE